MDPAPTTNAVKILQQFQKQLQQGVVTSPRTLNLVTTCLLCRGHLLLEDVPGLGKTTLAKTMAACLAVKFQRIQCTPDLLPADITGVSIYEQSSQSFRFVPGPVFTNILLADEINRTSPRTQSALLEAMAERTVTTDRKTRALPQTFMVIATQNPVEFSGTYPLPEAQLDRFFMRVSLGYPSLEQETEIMQMHQQGIAGQMATPVLKEEHLLKLQQAVERVRLDAKLMDYIATLLQATRQHKKIRLGASPRGAIALMRAAQAQALMQGKGYVTAQMIQDMVKPVLSHRILLRSAGDAAGPVLDEIVGATQVPAMPAVKADQKAAAPSTSSGSPLSLP